MQEVDQFLQGFLSLILPGDIGKTFAGLGLYIDLGVTLTKAHRIAAAHPITHETHEQLSYNEENGSASNYDELLLKLLPERFQFQKENLYDRLLHICHFVSLLTDGKAVELYKTIQANKS